MADPRTVAAQMARRYFRSPRDQRVFLRQMNQEAGFQDLTSPAGAQGYAQIMPATAKAWGVTNPHDPTAAYGAAAQHMADYLRQYGGSWRDALTAYNAGPGAVGGPLPAETRNYISTILGGSPDARAGATSSGSMPTENVQLATKDVFDQAGFEAARKRYVLATLLKGQPGYRTLFDTGVLSTAPPDQSQFTNQQLTSKTVTSGGSATGGTRGRVAVAASANRPGVGLAPELRSYVAQVAGRVGPLTITTGTNHNRMTVDGNVSDHWDGHAADIAEPTDSTQGDLVAAHALQVAGVPWGQAIGMAQRGGLYTLTPSRGPWAGHRVQVIWRTNQGGDHHNHVHIGVR